MMALAFLFFAFIYLSISVVVVLLVVRWAKKKNRSPKRWGIGVAVVMYLLVFWDHIPTLVAHKYYCEKEAGFWVYKTPEEWVRENPAVLEMLINNNRANSDKYPNWPIEYVNDASIARVNQRISIVYKNHFVSKNEVELPIHVWRWVTELVDAATGEVLVRQIDFSSGDGKIGGEINAKFWLQRESCERTDVNASNFIKELEKLKGQRK